MTLPLTWKLENACAQAYAEAYAYHGNLDLDVTAFGFRLQEIVDQQLESGAEGTASILLGKLHTKDLYLTCACSTQINSAWQRFLLLYGDHIRAVSKWVAPVSEAANDLASNLPGYLLLLDRSGRSRIASYDGRTSLATWLRVILTRQAINEFQRKARCQESLDEMMDVVDEMAFRRVESGARTARYGAMIRQAFLAAAAALSDRERLIVLWKYKDGLSESKIAGMLEIQPSSVCRQLQRVYRKLAQESARLLMTRYHLSEAAVAECLEEAREGLDSSLLTTLAAE